MWHHHTLVAKTCSSALGRESPHFFTSDASAWAPPAAKQFYTSWCAPTEWLNSDTHYSEIFSRPGCFLHFWPTNTTLEVPRFAQSLKWVTELRKTFYLLTHYQRIQFRNSQLERRSGKGMGFRYGDPMVLSRYTTFSMWRCSETLRTLFFGFLWRLPNVRYSRLHPWPLVTRSFSNPSPLPGGPGWAESSNL